MTISFRAVRGLRQQPLLVCVSRPAPDGGAATAFPTRTDANVRKLIALWEAREAPFTAVRSNLESSDFECPASSDVFSAGELVFDSVRSSILRNQKFRNFYDDIGAPPILMMGGNLESTILASAIDAYWFNVPFTVIGDAVYPARDLSEAECATAMKIITNFVDVVDVNFVEND